MRLTTMLALMFAVLAGTIASSHADTTQMFSNIAGRVFDEGKPAGKVLVEFVVFTENGKQFNAQTLTDDHGIYRIERAPYGKGYGKVTTPDGRGPATEYLEVNEPEIKVIFRL